MNKIKKVSQRGGKREGAGRPPEGKERYTVTLTAKHASAAKLHAGNFSGLLDELLADWINTHYPNQTRVTS